MPSILGNQKMFELVSPCGRTSSNKSTEGKNCLKLNQSSLRRNIRLIEVVCLFWLFSFRFYSLNLKVEAWFYFGSWLHLYLGVGFTAP